jgi:hypothetical protein
MPIPLRAAHARPHAEARNPCAETVKPREDAPCRWNRGCGAAQALIHLTTNAMTFTKRGSVVDVRLAERVGEAATLRFPVRNNGATTASAHTDG